MRGVPATECLGKNCLALATCSPKTSPDDTSSLAVSGLEQDPMSKASKAYWRNLSPAFSDTGTEIGDELRRDAYFVVLPEGGTLGRAIVLRCAPMRYTPDEMYAREVHAYEVHACEMHAHRLHACEIYVMRYTPMRDTPMSTRPEDARP